MEPATKPEIIAVVRQFTTTDGRASRETFWAAHGGFFLMCAGLGGVAEHLPESVKWVIVLPVFPLLLMLWIVQIRRCHDRNISGFWVLLNLMPCIGTLWVIAELGCQPGTPGPNRYGPEPAAAPKRYLRPRQGEDTHRDAPPAP